MKRLLILLAFLCPPAFADVGPINVTPLGTTTISVSSSAATALPRADTQRNQVELSNAGTVVVFVRFCPTSSCTASTSTDYPILPGQTKVVTINPDAQFIGTIAGSGTQTLYVSVGIGQ